MTRLGGFFFWRSPAAPHSLGIHPHPATPDAAILDGMKNPLGKTLQAGLLADAGINEIFPRRNVELIRYPTFLAS
ncbi:hypothetical protein [Pandoraea thiooxydans]|uniref:hypothetical protein n=1 Tax=Pandoraea thiooxydans TaxID=445709 RepID=UPI00147365F1|nr:hypothetical protein [Pandoraea thiooxydans]